MPRVFYIPKWIPQERFTIEHYPAGVPARFSVTLRAARGPEWFTGHGDTVGIAAKRALAARESAVRNPPSAIVP